MSSNNLIFAVIVLVVCLTQFASDIYAPSLPSISIALQTPMHLAQLSMAIYMFGVCISQLIYGPISEAIGRKKPLIIGLIIMLIGSLICLFATNIEMLIIARFIQGCGAGACACLWRPIFRDLFTGPDLAKYGSYFAIFIIFIVPSAPLLGGYLQKYFDWHANFLFMSIYTLVALIAIIYGFKETSHHHQIERLQFSYIKKTFGQLLTSPVFMGVTFCTFLSYGALFSWLIIGPVLLIDVIKISPVIPFPTLNYP
jgi:Bcr/CflA subfamily drug resistance transporter